MGPRILIVEDEPSLLLTLVANLELEGYDVACATSGEEALEALRGGSFDLVLSDIRMPGMSGVELYRRIRGLGLDLPVILMTAFALEGLVREAISHGAFTVLPKPFDVSHLLMAISAATRRPLVLVVDDDVPVAESMAGALAAAGVNSRAVYTGDDALAAIKEDRIDVCVVDMVMPGITGPELVERIRAFDHAIACIGMSGFDVPGMFQRAAPHVFVFVRKPLDIEKLLHFIARARGRPQAQRAAS